MKLHHKCILPIVVLALLGIVVGSGIAVAALVIERHINVTVGDPAFTVSPSADVPITVAPGATVQTDYGVHNNTDAGINVLITWVAGGGLDVTAEVSGGVPISSGSIVGIAPDFTETVWFSVTADNGDTSALVDIAFTRVS